MPPIGAARVFATVVHEGSIFEAVDLKQRANPENYSIDCECPLPGPSCSRDAPF
jgi:hypothetical protein